MKIIFIKIVFLFSFFNLFGQSKESNFLTAKISIIQSPPNAIISAKNNNIYVGLSFTNYSSEDIFIPEIMTALLNSDLGVFEIYKNDKYLFNYVDLSLSGKSEIWKLKQPKPPKKVMDSVIVAFKQPVSQTDLRDDPIFRYISDSVITYNKMKNEKIANSYIKENKNIDDEKLKFFIEENCIFLKSKEQLKFYFVSKLNTVLGSTGEYTIKYTPSLQFKNISYPNIDKILNYKRFEPVNISCNILSINIIGNDDHP
jgi:hypothetical protein